MVEIAAEALAPVVPAAKDGFTRYIRRDPLGLILTIAPWNYPYLTAVNTVVPGLIAGNAVILKAASQTILTGERFQAAMDKAGLPKGLFQHLVLGHEDTAKILVRRPRRPCEFHGLRRGWAGDRAGGGRHVHLDRARARRQGSRPTCALTPMSRTRSRTWSTGRSSIPGRAAAASSASTCTSAIWDRFVEGFAALTRQYVLGDPLDQATTLGPMAATRFADVVRRQTAQALAKGAKAHIDAAALPAQPRRHAVAGAAGADRGRPRHGCDDGGELRPGGRTDEGRRRRGGRAPHERFALWSDRVGVDARRSGGRADRQRASRPAPST